MIDLSYQNDRVLVFDPDDWLALRKQHRIVGGLVGCLPAFPRQNIFKGMPIELSPEETILLVENNIARLVELSNLLKEPDAEKKIKYEDDMVKICSEQNLIHREKRIKEIDSNLDKIIEGKTKKRKEESIPDRESIRNSEISKITNITTENCLLPIMLSTPEYVRGEPLDVSLDVIKAETNPIKYNVFKDLWNRGYFLSCGINFGGDFLVYLGDPVEYHASYIVRCIYDKNQLLHPLDLFAIGRLGNSVKKRILLASLNSRDNSIDYITLKWAYE